MSAWGLPVKSKYRVTSDAADHISRVTDPKASILCGIDLISLAGDDSLLAMSAGEVLYVHHWLYDNNFDTCGLFCVLRHISGDGADSFPVHVRYLHNERVDVKRGDTVALGQCIGMQGDTGFYMDRVTCRKVPTSQGLHSHIDFWVEHKNLARAEAAGLERFSRSREVPPWPGSVWLYNVNPTKFLISQGLDVVRAGG